jgi:hypothetical protein
MRGVMSMAYVGSDCNNDASSHSHGFVKYWSNGARRLMGWDNMAAWWFPVLKSALAVIHYPTAQQQRGRVNWSYFKYFNKR